MLRAALLALSGLALAGCLVLLALGAVHPALGLGVMAALVLAGTLYEKVRYKPVLPAPPGSGWRRTAERFHDPESGQPVTVYVDDAGERRYVQE